MLNNIVKVVFSYDFENNDNSRTLVGEIARFEWVETVWYPQEWHPCYEIEVVLDSVHTLEYYDGEIRKVIERERAQVKH